MELTKEIVKSRIDVHRCLDLSGMGIERLPAWITEFEIFGLYLPRNNITEFPDIDAFKSLVDINLSDNQIESLPDEICDLKSLKYLLLDGNKITELPKQIGDLRNLNILDIGRNNIKALPHSIVDLRELHVLNINCNPIEDIPDISHFNRLNYIDLCSTKVDVIDIIKKLPVCLKAIFCDSNGGTNTDNIKLIQALRVSNFYEG